MSYSQNVPEYHLDFTPEDLSLPEKFKRFHDQQKEAICRIADDFLTKRFVGAAMPTGAGKSLVYIVHALLQGHRVVVLTSTKGLQDQLMRDFASIGLVDIRGRDNYPCHEFMGQSCETGAVMGCRDGTSPLPPHETPACASRRDYRRALDSMLVVSNYDYWCAIHKYGEGLGDVDLLVCDEGHDARDKICSINTIEFAWWEISPRFLNCGWPAVDPTGKTLPLWQRWASVMLPRAEQMMRETIEAAKQRPDNETLAKAVKQWRRLVAKLDELIKARALYICDRVELRGDVRGEAFKLEPVWAAELAEETLFLGVPNVLLTSATMRPKTLDDLGIPEEDRSLQSYPSLFDRRRWPVYVVKGASLRFNAPPETYRIVWSHVDAIMRGRQDRKGMIHTTSYARCKALLSSSEWADCMITHEPGSKSAMVELERFRTMVPPAAMVSPAMTTGFDLPMDQCEYNILVKTPYPVTTSNVMRERCSQDPDYSSYHAATTVQQACGRGMRMPKDQCENFILDTAFWGLFKDKPHLFEAWFRRQVQYKELIPNPPPRLGR